MIADNQVKVKVAQVINYSLSFLGENAKNAIIYQFMNNHHLVSEEELADHVEDFEAYLTNIFGYGVSFIFPAMINRLYNQFNICPRSIARLTLTKAISEIKRRQIQ
ncbi:MAG: hypothetical protein ACUVQ8_04625 [Nitrososphaeria archaeon]